MFHVIAAELIMILHFLFVLFVLFGGLAVWRWPRVAWLHVPAFVWGIMVTAAGWICPLTPLEQELRRAAGSEGYSGDFVGQYLAPLLYPEGLSYRLKMSVAVLLVILNAGLYWRLFRRYRAQGGGN